MPKKTTGKKDLTLLISEAPEQNNKKVVFVSLTNIYRLVLLSNDAQRQIVSPRYTKYKYFIHSSDRIRCKWYIRQKYMCRRCYKNNM